MNSRRSLLAAVAAAALGPGPKARAQSRWPERPITLVVPFGPGGIADLTARAVAEPLGRALGQPVVVDNRPSAGSIVGTQAVTSAKPDGHTLLLMSNANAVSGALFRKLPFDVQRDLAPVGTLAFFDLGIFVAADSRFRTLGELLAEARAHPGKLNLGTIAIGSTQHLAARLFETTVGISTLVVPYKASPALLGALRGGEVDAAFEIAGPMLAQVQGGAVRALAVTGRRRLAALPQVPTVAEAGVAGYEVASWNALAAPAGTPPEVIAVLARALPGAVAAAAPALAALGVRAQAGGPGELKALLASEIERWTRVVRAAGITPE